jgi:hypothetical protein
MGILEMPSLRQLLRSKNPMPKTWENSQVYEFNFTRQWMEGEAFSDYLTSLKSDRSHIVATLKSYFFQGHEAEFDALCLHARDRQNLEIGPSCGPMIYGFAPTIPPYIIEPTGAKIVEYQRRHFGFDVFEGGRLFSTDAAKPIAEMERAIDGLIYVRNCIDHSPKWPFIVSNIARYAAPGCRLLFWSEMNHGPTPDIGHYNITDDVTDFLRMVEALGFKIDRHFSNDPNLPDLGIVATKL